jgi:hypothetical protein
MGGWMREWMRKVNRGNKWEEYKWENEWRGEGDHLFIENERRGH